MHVLFHAFSLGWFIEYDNPLHILTDEPHLQVCSLPGRCCCVWGCQWTSIKGLPSCTEVVQTYSIVQVNVWQVCFLHHFELNW